MATNRKNNLFTSMTAAAVAILMCVLTSLCRAASVEDIAMMKSADRQKILVEGAKREGKLTWYTTLIVDQVVRPVKEAFEKEYPFEQIDVYGGTAENIVSTIIT